MARAALFFAACALLTPGHCSGRGHSQGLSREVTAAAPDVCVVFASNVRGRTDFLARRATTVDRVRLEVPGVVQVDAGDLFPVGDPEDVERKARVVLAAYGRMGVDAITVGERELALEPEKLKSMARADGVSIVATNLVDSSGARVFESDRVIEAGKSVVGVFGIVDPSPAASASWSRQWGITTLDPVAETRRAVASLRARGARVIVGLFNGAGGVKRGVQISRMAGGVDVVIVGHSDDGVDRGLVRHPLVVHAGEDDTSIGRIDVRLRSGRPLLDVRMLTVTADVPEQLGVALTLRLDAGPVDFAPTVKREHWTYASNEACGFCHKPELAQWQTTEHALAFASLKDSGHGDAPACLGCHMTGFLRPGGTQFVQTAVEQMTDVGCECCHGPSAAHVGSVNKKKGTVLTVDPVICLGCHTPDQSVEPFDVLVAMKKIVGPGHESKQNR
jgi:hypothetical protein